MADKKDTLTVEFERLQGKINTLFKPIYDPIDEFFFELVAKFQKAGVDFLEVNNVKKTAIAKHSNYYEYPERRYAVVVNDKNKVKFYELEFSNSDVDKSAKEIAQKEFEDLTISTYLKPNPLQTKEDQEEDKDPEQPDEEGSKKKEDKDSINKDKKENFFAWWKRHLKVYHLIARSEHGLMVQILAGLITYLLLAIYCHRQFNERVSIKRVRQLRIKIQNELRMGRYDKPPDLNLKEHQLREVSAKT